MSFGFKDYLFKYIFTFFVSVSIFILFMYLPTNKWAILGEYSFSFLMTSVVLFLLGGLDVCLYFGVFDMVSYLFRKDRSCRSVKEYSDQKRAKRKRGTAYPFYPYFLYAILFLIVGLFFLIFN